MSYQVNFCETKEQLKHLAEVVTGKADGSPTGADIDTSTLAYAGLVRDTLPELLSKLGWYSVGEWSSDPLISNVNEYVLYNGIRYVPLSIPYQVNSTANPDPEVLVGTELKVITDVTDEEITEAQNDIVGGSIFKGSNGKYVQNGDVVDPGITHLRALIGGKPSIVSISPISSGIVSDLSDTGATIGVNQVTFRSASKVYFQSVKDMIDAGVPVGTLCSTGLSDWVKTSSINDITSFDALGVVFIDDFKNYHGDNTKPFDYVIESLINKGETVDSKGEYDIYLADTVNFNNKCSFSGEVNFKPAPLFSGDNLSHVTSSNVSLSCVFDGLEILPKFSSPYVGGVPFVGAGIVCSSNPLTPITGTGKVKLVNVDLTGVRVKNTPNSAVVGELCDNSILSNAVTYNTAYDEVNSSPASMYMIGCTDLDCNKNDHTRVIKNGLGNTKDITLNNCHRFNCKDNRTRREYADATPVVEHGFHTHVFVKASSGGEVSGNKGYDVGVGVKVEADCVGVNTHDNSYELVYEYILIAQGHIKCEYDNNTGIKTRRYGFSLDVHSPSASGSSANYFTNNKVIESNEMNPDGYSSDNRAAYVIRAISGLSNIGSVMRGNYSDAGSNAAYAMILITDDPASNSSIIQDLNVIDHVFSGSYSSALIGFSGRIEGVNFENPILNNVVCPVIFSKFLYTEPVVDLSFRGAKISKGCNFSSIIQSGTYGGSLEICDMTDNSSQASFTVRIASSSLDSFVYSGNSGTKDDGSNILITGSTIESISIKGNEESHADNNPYYFLIDATSDFGILNLIGNSHRGRGKYLIQGGSGKIGISDNSATALSEVEIDSGLTATGYIGYNNLTSNPKVSHAGALPPGIITMP